MAVNARTLEGAATRGGSVRTASDRLSQLRWVATIAPAVAVFAYETLRHSVIEHYVPIPELYGNLITGLLALLMSFYFSRAIFGSIRRIQDDAVEEIRRAAALTAMVEERERLSRELHDGLAQVASYLLVRLDTVRNLVESGRSAEATHELELLRSAMDEVNADVRESIAGLRSRVAERGLAQALEDYLEEFEERHDIATSLTAERTARSVSPYVGMQLFRIAQEALTNVRKHSKAHIVTVGLAVTDEAMLEMSVCDDGVGFNYEEASRRDRSFGLAGMRERAESLGGSYRVTTSPTHGTRICITIPMDARG